MENKRAMRRSLTCMGINNKKCLKFPEYICELSIKYA